MYLSGRIRLSLGNDYEDARQCDKDLRTLSDARKYLISEIAEKAAVNVSAFDVRELQAVPRHYREVEVSTKAIITLGNEADEVREIVYQLSSMLMNSRTSQMIERLKTLLYQ